MTGIGPAHRRDCRPRFVALFVSLFVIHPDSGETNCEIVAYYEDAGNRTNEHVAGAAAIALLTFASAMAARLAQAAGGATSGLTPPSPEERQVPSSCWSDGVVQLGIVSAYDYEQFQLDLDVARVVESTGFISSCSCGCSR